MKKSILGIVASVALQAHFGVVLPDSDVVTDTKKQTIKVEFIHPFEQAPMNMVKPNEFGYFLDGKKTVLTDKLQERKLDGKYQAWKYEMKFKEMGDYIFYVDPVPYWEPSEEKFIRHITKVIVDAHYAGEGWDAKTSLKAEIVPLSRPYSLYAGNVFSGTVYYKGEPLPYAEVEVEFMNDKKGFKAPTQNHITQVIKADKNGVFTYAMPKQGWWGFAALMEDDVKEKKDGKEYPVELGAVIWVKAYGMK